MKKILSALVFAVAFAVGAQAQGTVVPPSTVHYVKVTLKSAPSDANATTNYKFYVDLKACPADGSAPSTATLANSAVTITGLVYYDIEPVGPYCYYVTAVTNGVESAPSNTSTAVIRPFAPVISTATN
jgi:hypothetical protein